MAKVIFEFDTENDRESLERFKRTDEAFASLYEARDRIRTRVKREESYNPEAEDQFLDDLCEIIGPLAEYWE